MKWDRKSLFEEYWVSNIYQTISTKMNITPDKETSKYDGVFGNLTTNLRCKMKSEIIIFWSYFRQQVELTEINNVDTAFNLAKP